MKRVLTVLVLLITMAGASFAQCSDLFISEYVEGYGNNNGLEIYNPTPNTIDLSNYVIKRYANGSGVPSETFNLSGTLASGDVVVVINGQIDSVWVDPPGYWSEPTDLAFRALADLFDSPTYPSTMYFNGDDAMTLETIGGAIVDIFGKVGEDPGSAWTDDATANYTDANGGTWWTKRKTLIRKSSVTGGITSNPTGFNATLEWDSLPEDSWDSLGSHTCSCPGGSVLSANVIGTDPTSCGINNGTATVTATGGNPPYTYLWSSGGTTASNTGLSAGNYDVTVTDASSNSITESITLLAPGTPTATITATDPSGCGATDGAAVVVASGGTAPYTYLWSSGGTGATETNLGAGTYTVTVTGANACSVTVTTVLTSSGGGASISFISTDVGCYGNNDGSAAVSASGGSSPYTYLWSTGETSAIINNLSSGTYSITVTGNSGCPTSSSLTITEPTEILAIYSTTSPSCGSSNGEITLITTGGTPPYTYIWDSNAGSQTTATATGLTAGTYTVTIIDGSGCTKTVDAGLSNIGAPAVAIVGSNVTCAGGSNGSASSTVSGGTPPIVHSWSTGSSNANISGLSAGTYTLTITDSSGCVTVESVTITEPAALITNMSYSNTSGTACNGQASVSVSGGTPSYQYLWDDPSNQSNSTASGLCIGNYTVVVNDANGCTLSGTIYVDSIVMGIESPIDLDFKIFPNPSEGKFTVTVSSSSTDVLYIEVIDLLGRRAYFKPINGALKSVEILMDEEERGIYLLNLVTEKGVVARTIIIR